ncbi:transcriptional regulator [Marinobacterium nitratireducens]|uniref:Transcriptional regulator n=1 Tax=Marinobacterium nitratireducens TaxID=518897 RepID=A0A917ZM88_9GAMM|nr:helix-turn-helix domain-containing protein [Marinobacterium nitratireducens]GGO85357.1 transcriptional regulator [Marinobacterium nitratireducens]
MRNNSDIQSQNAIAHNTQSTENIPQREKLDYWRSLVEEKVVPLEFKVVGDTPFEGSLYSSELGPATLSFIKATPHIAQRTPLNRFSPRSDSLVFNIVLLGNLIATQDGRESSLPTGTGVVVNAERAYRLNITQNSELAVLQVPRKMLSRSAPGLDRVVARNLATNNPYYPLIVAYVKELAIGIASLPPLTAKKIADNLADLLAAMVSETVQHSSTLISDHKFANLLRIKTFVEEHLQNSELCPATVASSLGISTRYINQLLAVEDTSLSRYIWQQRLERVARCLRDPALVCQNISTLAFSCGFNDTAHFSKTFRKRYSLSPSEYRRQHLGVC